MKYLLPIFLFLTSYFALLTSALPVRAQQTEQNTAIFTGQIIPAYLGGAYDPSEGFKKLAGLPIYVFAYDRWGGGGFVIGNYAVRTQIRADGSFQAQGLPTAAHYGVYFPFKLDGGNVVRTDGITEGVQSSEFRWPTDDDRIRDVFSYVTGDPSAITIKDQFGQDITLGQAFLTNETRLDIDNTINVFPVVPHRVLRVAVQLAATEETGSYEVYAQRVAVEWTPANRPDLTMVLSNNFPVIRGRTSIALPSNGAPLSIFQAYAPEGYYAITVWRTEVGSVGYKDWDGDAANNPVNSTYSGLGFLKVHRDWQAILNQIQADPNKDNIIMQVPNRIIVWGLVTNEEGIIQTPDNTDPALVNPPNNKPPYINVNVNTQSDTRKRYSPKMKTSDDFYTGGIWGPGPDTTWKGLYSLYQVYDANNSSLNEFSWLYIDQENFKKNPTPLPQIVDGTSGPLRINLTASQGEVPAATIGYDKGLHIDAGGYSIAKARLIPLSKSKFPIPAVTKTHPADRLGWIHILDKDLQKEQEDFPYRIEVLAGSRIFHKDVVYPQHRYLETQVVPVLPSLTDRYYKILGLIPVPFYVEAQGTDEVTIDGTVKLPKNSQIEELSIFIRSAGEPEAQPCLEKDGCKYDTTNLKDGNFSITLPKPITPKDAEEQCLKRGGLAEGCRKWGVPENWESYKINIRGTYLYGELGTLTVLDSGEQLVSVSDQGNSKPPTISLRLDIDCGRIVGESKAPIVGPLINLINRWPCNIANGISNIIVGLFAEAEHKLLRTSPVTQEAGLVQIWNLIRNMVNVLFVIFLIAIGISTILRYEPKTWSPGILLPRLFIGIVMANFSLLIVQLLIDINNVLTHFIFQYTHNILSTTGISYQGIVLTGEWAGKAALLNALGGAISGAGAGALAGLLGGGFTGGALAVLIVPILLAILGFFLTIALMVLGFILIFYLRYAIIWIATAIAPLVFALGVFPAMENFRDMWWNTLLPFTIMQTVTAFVLSIGLLLLSVGAGNSAPFAGAGVFLVGIIALGLALKVPATVSSWFKGGLLGGKELGALSEGVVGDKGMVGSKVAGMKEGLSATEATKGIAYQRAKGASKLGALFKGIASGARKTVEKEEDKFKAVKEGTEEGLFPGETRSKKLVIEPAENINRMNKEWKKSGHPYQGASITRPKYDAWGMFAENAPHDTMINVGKDYSVTDPSTGATTHYTAGSRVRMGDYLRHHNLLDKKGDAKKFEAIQHFQQMSKGTREERAAYNSNFSTASTYVHGIKTT